MKKVIRPASGNEELQKILISMAISLLIMLAIATAKDLGFQDFKVVPYIIMILLVITCFGPTLNNFYNMVVLQTTVIVIIFEVFSPEGTWAFIIPTILGCYFSGVKIPKV